MAYTCRMAVRDNFSAATRRLLAARAGHRCSNPGCMRATSGPALDETKAIDVGEAAHITAAARGGKRFDENLRPEERSAESNGIWLCSLCAGLIDKDDLRYTVEVLRKWKQDALTRALRDITTRMPGAYPAGAVAVEFDDDDRAFLGSLALPAEDDVETVVARMREAAARDIAAFRAVSEWPAHAIALNLTLRTGDGRYSISLAGMADGVNVAEVLNLVSPPGTGKTTTMVQLAGAIYEGGHAVPALVPLGEWSDRPEDFFAFLLRRNAFRTFRPQHFMQVAYCGRLTLLLDGWNELDPGSRIRALRDLRALRRDYPLLGIVIGTRRDLRPLSGPVVEIEALSEDQQLELARALRARDGEALVDQAWRTAGVRELVAIPLYLTALLGTAPGAKFPQTMEEVLRLFVTQQEQIPEKAAILRRELFGFHGEMLTALAVEANRTAKPQLPETLARQVISHVTSELSARRQISAAPQPATVIEVLVNNHILIRPSSGGDGISFQHQQFQEWYASLSVGTLMMRAAGGDAAARQQLRADVLNWPAWEESILFACERLSRDGASGVQAVVSTIRDALAIDPMLAAEMIFRSTAEVWTILRTEVVAFATRWHRPGQPDRAARFMMTAACPEFAPQIWPLMSSPDSQIQLTALRLASRFRPSVLGDEAASKIAALPQETRGYVMAEIAMQSGFDGVVLAAQLAKSDPSAKVVVEVLQALQFRRADRLVGEIMQSASEEIWQRVVREGYPDQLTDPAQTVRLIEVRRAELAAQTEPLQVLGNLTQHRLDVADAEARIAEMIASADFPLRDDRADFVIGRAYAACPQAVAEGLVRRIAAGLELPFRGDDYLKDIAVVDEGPVAAVALDMTRPERPGRGAFAVVGPKTVGTLLDKLFALDEEFRRDRRMRNEAERNDYRRLRDAIGRTRTDSFLTALLDRAETDQLARIEMLADLLAWRLRPEGDQPEIVAEECRPALVRTIGRWVDAMLNSPEANRHQFAHVVRAIARFPDPQFVAGLERMLERDLADWTRAREERARSAGIRSASPDATHAYTLDYQRAFAAIGGGEVVGILKRYLPDLLFGADAAGALSDMWNREHPSPTARPFASWHDYSRAKALQQQRREAPNSLATSDFAELIFEVVRSIGTPEVDPTVQRHALGLAVVGLGLPHGEKRTEIEALIALPLPFAAKRRLLIGAAMAGEIVPANALIAGIDELLEAGRTEPRGLGEDRGELMGWVELFAFSDRPETVLEVIGRLPRQYSSPRSLERLLSALGKSAHRSALGVLEALAERDPGMAAEHSWLNALIALGTEESARALLVHICDGQLAANYEFHIARDLERLGRLYPAIKAEVVRRYEGMGGGRAKSILERALIELADVSIILTLIGGYAVAGRPYDGGLSQAVRRVALGQRPAEGWGEGAYEEFSVSLAGLRQQLFGIVLANEARSALAERCLISIEKLRDEHGRVDDEPRHPDLESGQAWPIIRW
jgi:hypothetical protein